MVAEFRHVLVNMDEQLHSSDRNVQTLQSRLTLHLTSYSRLVTF